MAGSRHTNGSRPPAFALLNESTRGCGEIGRRTRFRFWRRKAWGFKSLHPHHNKAKMRPSLTDVQKMGDVLCYPSGRRVAADAVIVAKCKCWHLHLLLGKEKLGLLPGDQDPVLRRRSHGAPGHTLAKTARNKADRQMFGMERQMRRRKHRPPDPAEGLQPVIVSHDQIARPTRVNLPKALCRVDQGARGVNRAGFHNDCWGRW